MNFIVENKKDFTTHFSNILSPLIFEGFTSVYNDTRKISLKNETLKNFQECLSKIPKWNQNMIESEYIRINNIVTFFLLNY